MEDGALGEQLMEWAKTMNYTPPPGKPFPDVTMFQKLCKGNTIPLWRQVIRTIKPAEEVRHIRETLLQVQREEASKAGSHKPLPKNLEEKLQLGLKIKAQKIKKAELLDEIHILEESILNKRKVLMKSVSKMKEKEREQEECKRKLSLLKLKKREVSSNISLIRDFAATADVVCPPTCDVAGSLPAVSVQNCIDALRKFHASKATESEENRQSGLWSCVVSNVSGLTAESLWSAILQKMDQQISEISAAVSVPVHYSANPWESLKGWGSSGEQLSLLSGMYLETFLEGILLKAKINMKYKDCDKLLENFATELLSKDYNTTSLKVPPEDVKKWLELKFKREELHGTLQKLKSEISMRKERLPNLSDVSSKLKECKVLLLQLEDDIKSETSYIEESLSATNHTSDSLKSAQKKVTERLNNFKALYQRLQIEQNEKEWGITSSTPGTSDPDLYAETARRPLSSTLIGNITACSNITLNISTHSSSIGSAHSDQYGAFMSQYVSLLKDAVSKEARKFFKLSLEMIPSVHIDETIVPECCLIVNTPSVIPRVMWVSGGSSEQNWLQLLPGAPVSTASSILLKQLHSLNHHRALLLCQVLNPQKSISPSLCAMLNLESLKVHSVRESSLKTRMNDIDALLEDAVTHLSTCKETFDMWSTRSIQEAVPPSLVVKGKSFAAWRKQYEASMASATEYTSY